MYAIGGNPSAALRPASATRCTPAVFACDRSARRHRRLITTGRRRQRQRQLRRGREFDVLTAVLLGGIGFAGGSGRIERTLAGVLVSAC